MVSPRERERERERERAERMVKKGKTPHRRDTLCIYSVLDNPGLAEPCSL